MAKTVLGINTKAFNTGQRFTIVDGKLSMIPDNLGSYITNGYNVNDIVYSTVNVQLDKVRLAPWSLYKVVDDSSLKRANALIGRKNLSPRDYKRSIDIRKKALEPLKNPGKWGELLKCPNEEDSWNDFVAHGCGYKLLTGNNMIWGDVLQAGAAKGIPNSLHNMPSQYVQLRVAGKWPQKVVGYDLTLMGLTEKAKYEVEEVIHIKYSNYEAGLNGENLYGVSPLKALIRKINRNNSAVDAAAAKFQNGGLEAIIYVDENESTINRKDAFEQANTIKKFLINEGTGPLNTGKIATSGYRMGVEQMGLSPVELAIIESEKFDMVSIAAAYGVPPELIGFTGTKTYDNIKTAEVALTTRCALPLLVSFRDKLNEHARKHWGLPQDQIIDFDTTVFTELQEDIGEMMKWVEPMANLTGVSANTILDLLGMERIEEKEYDQPRVTPQMGQFLEDWRLNPVDKALEDGDMDTTGGEEDV